MDFSASFLEGEAVDVGDDVEEADDGLRLAAAAARGSLLMRLLKKSDSTLCSFCPPFPPPREGVPSAAAAAAAALVGVASGVEGVLRGVTPTDGREAERAGVLGAVPSTAITKAALDVMIIT
jgi:hypothetical protein